MRGAEAGAACMPAAGGAAVRPSSPSGGQGLRASHPVAGARAVTQQGNAPAVGWDVAARAIDRAAAPRLCRPAIMMLRCFHGLLRCGGG